MAQTSAPASFVKLCIDRYNCQAGADQFDQAGINWVCLERPTRGNVPRLKAARSPSRCWLTLSVNGDSWLAGARVRFITHSARLMEQDDYSVSIGTRSVSAPTHCSSLCVCSKNCGVKFEWHITQLGCIALLSAIDVR